MNRTKINVAVLLLMLIVTSAGCGSLMTTFGHPLKDPIYGGVKVDWMILTEENEGRGASVSEKVLFGIDIPFSAIMDSLLLPYTIPKQLAIDSDASNKSSE